MQACLSPAGSVLGEDHPSTEPVASLRGWGLSSLSHLSMYTCISLHALCSPDETRQVHTLLYGFHVGLLSLKGENSSVIIFVKWMVSFPLSSVH